MQFSNVVKLNGQIHRSDNLTGPAIPLADMKAVVRPSEMMSPQMRRAIAKREQGKRKRRQAARAAAGAAIPELAVFSHFH